MIEQSIRLSKKLPKKQRKSVLLTKTFIVSLVLFSSFILFSGLFTILILDFLQERSKALPDIQSLVQDIPFASEIYDRNGKSLFRLHNDYSNSDKVYINEINSFTYAAFLAAEDSTFLLHDGYRTDAIVRCTLRSFNNNKLCGGSTITQQIVKIITKNNEPTISRKVEEVFLASHLEKNYPKDVLLELYFNITPYGSNIVGIKTASDFYFNKNVNDLSLAKSVILAAIVNDPIKLSPTLSSDNERSRNELEERKKYVFSQLIQKIDVLNNQLISAGFSNEQLINLDQIEAVL